MKVLDFSILGVKALLACGHWSEHMHVSTSALDFYDQPDWCPVCQTERQWHPYLQAMIMDSLDDPYGLL